MAGCAGQVEPGGALNQSLNGAAREYRVPVALLKAIGYVETRFADDEPTMDHGFGVMKIVDREDAPFVAEAAAILGVNADQVRTDRATNVRAMAALLRHYAESLSGRTGDGLTWDDWSLAVQKLSGIPDEDLAAEHAETVFATMREGAVVRLPDGEEIDLRPESDVGELGAYITRAYPSIRFVAASTSNYAVGRGGNAIDKIIIHTVQGSYASCISWFRNPAAQVTAHYVVRSSDGQITQMVNEANTAWHAGNSTYNRQSIGIEHEGFVNNAAWYTDAMYASSAKLTCAIAARYNIPIDRSHIIGHIQVPGATHTDPGPNWNWTKYMALVKACIAGGTSTPPPPPPPPAGCALGDGLYCGGNGVPGDSRTLYHCISGTPRIESACVACERMPAGSPDRCKATTCPYGDGVYCGGNAVGGSTSTLYRCTAGRLTVISACAKGCFRAPVGVADRCN